MITVDERNWLRTNMKHLLNNYYYNPTDEALDVVIDEWYRQKGGLIEAFKQHPNYLPGRFMIAFESNYEREIDPSASDAFYSFLYRYAFEQCKSNLPEDIKDRMKYWQSVPYDISDFFETLYRYAERCISDETANLLNNICPAVRAHTGEKTSRVVNRLCCYLGYDKAEGYNKAFAKYADSLSPVTITRHTILSLNPLDYLTMSFGNSWSSCHTIDKTNQRDMPNSYQGQYSSGTMSYMLDPSSMVMYTVDGSYDGIEYWNEPKVTRQMFHWGADKLVQGRLYPQSNDGLNSFYTPYRNIVQEIISTIFDFPNLWTLRKDSSNASMYIYTMGTHYPDYYHFNGCNVSIVKGSTNAEKFTVGATPICITCGRHHEVQGSVSCCGGGGVAYCASCGREIYEDGDHFIDGEWYCGDCVSYCDCCSECHVNESTYVESYDGYVCESCLEDYFVYCETCDSYHHRDNAEYVEEMNQWVCDECIDYRVVSCSRCGTYHNRRNMHTYDGEFFDFSCYMKRLAEEEAN